MKIAFLCSSLASGRNGVGDYAKCLAAALAEDGHVCRLFALHERQPDAAEGDVILPASLSWKERAHRLETEMAAFDPDFVSWQMVPYGFHPKGILPAEVSLLADAVRRWPQHVMLHELWLGLAAGEDWQKRLIGAWQRRRLLAFLRHLEPAVLHTSNATYQTALHAAGWTAARLALFGNIPIATCSTAEAEAALAAVAGITLPPEPRWVAVTFGTIHPKWNAAETLAWLRAASVAAGRHAVFLSLGRAGANGESRLSHLARQNPDLPIVVSGALAPDTISRLLQAADLGIATHPWALIDKSGGTAAMCEHGLPVLVPRDDWHLEIPVEVEEPAEPLLARLTHVPPSAASSWIEGRRRPAPRLPAIAAQFVNDLATASSRRSVLV